MTGRPDDQGVEPASGQDNSTLDAQAWQRWRSGRASPEEIERWQQQLQQQLPLLPQQLLDPSLLPIALLRNPSQWSPEDSGLDPIDLLACHRDLTDPNQLLSSGRLGEIALGQRSLFTDLPPVHLQAYRDGLRPAARNDSLSALEHLGGVGRQRFQQGQPLGMDLDRYQPPIPDPVPREPIPSAATVLVVLHPTQEETEAESARSSPTKGWSEIRHASLEDTSGWIGAPFPDDEILVSFCHASDQLDSQAALRMAHCPEVLLQRSIQANPTVPDVASPADRHCWTPELSAEILAISQRHSPGFLEPGGELTPIQSLSACHQLKLRADPMVLVSVLIPFRDRVDLTQSCVASLRRCAGAVAYELCLLYTSPSPRDLLKSRMPSSA